MRKEEEEKGRNLRWKSGKKMKEKKEEMKDAERWMEAWLAEGLMDIWTSGWMK